MLKNNNDAMFWTQTYFHIPKMYTETLQWHLNHPLSNFTYL